MTRAKTVVVTGGGKGIGAAITRAFHADGARVVIGSRSDSGLAKELGANARFVAGDVRDAGSHRRFVETAVSWGGGLDVYVNCAGYSAWNPVGDVDESFWDAMIDTNLKGTFLGCQAASSALKSGGAIVNVSSLAGKRGSANNSVYCASKFGVNGITQALAKELGPRGIRVNAVCPVYVVTEGVTEALEEKVSPAGGQPVAAYLAAFAAGNAALGRLPAADEVARMCVFLTAEGSSAVTGQCINVDCGVLPQ